jgi:hypothetical protein
VVKAEAAIALKEAGVRKSVYLMALFSESMAPELARHGIVPCLYSDDALRLIEPMVRTTGGPITAQIYLDTGMSHMGIPYHREPYPGWSPWSGAETCASKVCSQDSRRTPTSTGSNFVDSLLWRITRPRRVSIWASVMPRRPVPCSSFPSPTWTWSVRVWPCMEDTLKTPGSNEKRPHCVVRSGCGQGWCGSRGYARGTGFRMVRTTWLKIPRGLPPCPWGMPTAIPERQSKTRGS